MVGVVIKHAGKTYPYELDTSKSVPHLREEVYTLTNVVPANQKILIKGVLKDDVDLSKLAIKSVSRVLSRKDGLLY